MPENTTSMSEPTAPMLAWHADPALKAEAVARLRRQVVHEAREMLLTGETVCWGDGLIWPCPGELARRADAIRNLHPVEGYCPQCGRMAPCVTRRAADGEVLS